MIINQRRRDLLPIWMKFFIWAFMILAALSSIIYLVYMFTGIFFGYKETSIYGMETQDLFSPLWIFITALLLFKVFISFSMWTEKRWVIDLGILDAVLGIIICMYMMFIKPLAHVEGENYEFKFRIEIVFLIPYLYKCIKINNTWKNMKNYVPNPTIKKENLVKFSNEKTTNDLKIAPSEISQSILVNEYVPKENIDRENDDDYLKRYMPK